MNLIDKEAQILADVKAILGQGGIASKALPSSFVYNEDQVEYALSVVKGFCRYKEETGKTSINALDAATGTGKTLGYLVPLFLCASYSGLRVAVSTFTRQLQRQLLRKEGDVENVTAWVAEVTGKSPLTVSLRMGIKNYISHTACENHRDRLAKDDSGKFLDAIATLEDMMDWLKGTGKYEGKEVSGLMQQYMDDANLESLPFGVKSKNIWLTHKSPIDERANYIKMVFDSKKADVLVINHALLALHAYRWTSILDGEEDRPISLLVCDEADKLPAATEMVVSEDISLHILQKNTKDAGLGGGQNLRPVHHRRDHPQHQRAGLDAGRQQPGRQCRHYRGDWHWLQLQPDHWCGLEQWQSGDRRRHSGPERPCVGQRPGRQPAERCLHGQQYQWDCHADARRRL